MVKFLEKNIKHDLLKDKGIINYNLGDLGKSIILNEKVLIPSYLRADYWVPTEKKGDIGIEIKNAYDNLDRLQRQLLGYITTCKYVYVCCASCHLLGVFNILKRLHLLNIVGVITYDIFDEMVVPGLYKPAHKNPYFKVKDLMKIPWKSELIRILIMNAGKKHYVKSKYGLSVKQYEQGKRSYFKYPNPSKKQIINTMLTIFGPAKCSYCINMLYITNDSSPLKDLNERHFRG